MDELFEALYRIELWHKSRGLKTPGIAFVYEDPAARYLADSALKHKMSDKGPIYHGFDANDNMFQLAGVALKLVSQEARY